MDGWIGCATELALALGGAGFFASIETALAGVPEIRVRDAVEDDVAGAGQLGYWLVAPHQILATLFFLRVALMLLAGVCAVQLLQSKQLPLTPATVEGLGVVAAALAALLISHLLPRAIAKRYAFGWARLTIGLVRALTFALTPIVGPLTALARGISRLLGAPSDSDGHAHWTSDEIAQLAQSARAAGLDKPGEDLLLSIIEFSDTVIREIMVPRTDMVAVPVDAPEDEVSTTVISAGHSRIPVYEETVDNIVGILYVKDMFVWTTRQRSNGQSKPFVLRSVLRPTFYVPEVMKISELLRDFQRRKTHMAIVVDEYGGTAGVVTLEDIIEEIVGEIQDEYDVEDKQFRTIGDNKIIADGRVNLWELQAPLNVEFPDDAGYETLAGFITARVGYLPEPGTVLDWNGLRFCVKEANEKRIRMVEIERAAAHSNAASRT